MSAEEMISAVMDGTGGMLAPVAVVVGVLLLFGLVLRLTSPAHPYRPQGALFTPAERAFLRALEQAVDGRRVGIAGKVRIADVLAVKKGAMSQKRWWKAFTRISSKHVDFVLYDRHTTHILAAIELDDRSHDKRDRRKRDVFVDRAFEAAGVGLFRFRVASRHDPATIRERLAGVLSGST